MCLCVILSFVLVRDKRNEMWDEEMSPYIIGLGGFVGITEVPLGLSRFCQYFTYRTWSNGVDQIPAPVVLCTAVKSENSIFGHTILQFSLLVLFSMYTYFNIFFCNNLFIHTDSYQLRLLFLIKWLY